MDAGGRAMEGGVSTEDVKKNNDILWLEFKPEKGSWAVGLLAGYSLTLTSPDGTLLPEISTSTWIWICLDYKEGWVAFFSVSEGISIFTFPLVLSERKKSTSGSIWVLGPLKI